MEKRFETRRSRASARDVLGSPESRNGIDPKWRKHFERLTEMREHLLERRADLGRLENVEEANFSINPADRGSDEYDRSEAFSLFSGDQNALFEIEAALHRIRDGTFGICEATGETIPEDRLEAVPWARFVKDVETDLERAAAAHKEKHIL